MSQALYRKWRPQSWDAVVGQDHVVQTLRNAITAERVAHAYLFAGPRGTGKTTTARLLAKAVNCLEEDLAARPCGHCEHCLAVAENRFLDLIEIDAASNTSVEDVRDLRDKINFSPNQGRYKVYIIDEVHMLSTAAFNALLKTLEEPPSHAIFILATTEVHKIPATVLSRCQRHEFRRIPVVDIVALLQRLAEGEGISAEPEALALIARQSTGAMRDAISLLDQLASTGKPVSVEMAHDLLGTAASQSVVELVDDLVTREAGRGLDRIRAALDSGSDPRQFARQVVDYLRSLLLIRLGNGDRVDASVEQRAQMARHAQVFETGDLLRIIKAFNAAAADTRAGWQPSLPLEMAFIEALEGPAPAPQAPETTQPARPVTQPAPPSRPAAGPRPTAPRPPAEPESGAPAPAGPGANSDDLLLRRVNENWRQILQEVREENSHTQGLLNSSKPFGVKDGVLFLAFNGPFAKTKIEEGEHLEIVRRVFQRVLGEDVPLRCIVGTGRKGSLPPDVDSDGMVAAAMRDLGGEIVDIQ